MTYDRRLPVNQTDGDVMAHHMTISDAFALTIPRSSLRRPAGGKIAVIVGIHSQRIPSTISRAALVHSSVRRETENPCFLKYSVTKFRVR
jgi:hypothetical protein